MNLHLQPVLLIEDNDDDVFLMRRAVKKAALPWHLNVASDGQEALDYLAAAGKFGDRSQFPLPSLVFLDLKLPYVSGFDVLTCIQANPRWKDLPVVILTSSPEERDQRRAIALGARLYLIKPPSEDVLQTIARGDWTRPGNSTVLRPGPPPMP